MGGLRRRRNTKQQTRCKHHTNRDKKRNANARQKVLAFDAAERQTGGGRAKTSRKWGHSIMQTTTSDEKHWGGGGGKKATAIPLRHVKPSGSDSETTALIDRRERSTRRFRGGRKYNSQERHRTDRRASANEQRNDHSLVSFYGQRHCVCDAVRGGNKNRLIRGGSNGAITEHAQRRHAYNSI